MVRLTFSSSDPPSGTQPWSNRSKRPSEAPCLCLTLPASSMSSIATLCVQPPESNKRVSKRLNAQHHNNLATVHQPETRQSHLGDIQILSLVLVLLFSYLANRRTQTLSRAILAVPRCTPPTTATSSARSLLLFPSSLVAPAKALNGRGAHPDQDLATLV